MPFRPLLLTCAVVLTSGTALAQGFPAKPINFIVPFAPGGGSGIVAQMLQPKLSEIWGQPVIVESRPGGNTVIGHEALLRLPADGHAFVISTPSFVLTALLQKLSYDPYKDFAPLTTLYNSEQVLTVTPSLPITTLKEMIAYAKARPGQLNYATVGSGGSTHLASEMINMMAGIDTRQVNYKGAGPALVDQMAGHVQMSFTAPAAALSLIKSGKIRAIAITGDKRTPAMADVPTMAEAGLPNFGGTIWFGVQAHGKTPRPIVNRLSTDISRLIMRPEISEELVRQATQPFVMTPEAFAARMQSDSESYAKIIKAANIKFE